MKQRLLKLLLLLLGCTALAGTDRSALDEWSAFSRTGESRELNMWLRVNAGLILNMQSPDTSIPVSVPGLSGRAGMFITFIRKGKVRGCYGAFYHDRADTS